MARLNPNPYPRVARPLHRGPVVQAVHDAIFDLRHGQAELQADALRASEAAQDKSLPGLERYALKSLVKRHVGMESLRNELLEKIDEVVDQLEGWIDYNSKPARPRSPGQHDSNPLHARAAEAIAALNAKGVSIAKAAGQIADVLLELAQMDHLPGERGAREPRLTEQELRWLGVPDGWRENLNWARHRLVENLKRTYIRNRHRPVGDIAPSPG
jgi:hypothetical protein